MTDRAIPVAGNRDVDRLVVHYMQPHIPFLDYPELTCEMTDGESNEFSTPTTRRCGSV